MCILRLRKLRLRFPTFPGGKLCPAVCGQPLCLGRNQPHKGGGLFRLYHESHGEIRRISASLLRLSGQDGQKSYLCQYEAGRSDFLCGQQRQSEPCGNVYRKWPDRPCGQQAERDQDIHMELPFAGGDPKYAGLTRGPERTERGIKAVK